MKQFFFQIETFLIDIKLNVIPYFTMEFYSDSQFQSFFTAKHDLNFKDSTVDMISGECANNLF